MANFIKFCVFCTLFFSFFICFQSKETIKDKGDEKWKKKDIRDYSEADLERLYEQWEDNDEDELEEDELPQHKRKQEKVDMSKIDPSNPESVLQSTKKGKTLMMFASISGNPSKKETEQISAIWQQGLYNGNVELQRYVVGEDRVLFVVNDGSMAWQVKDFLVKQDRCKDVTIEGKVYEGAGIEMADKSKKKKKANTEENETLQKDEL